MKVVHITDFHLPAPGTMLAMWSPQEATIDAWSRVDTALKAAVEQKPDAVVITGDLLDRSNTDPHRSMELVAEKLNAFTKDHQIPVVTIPGNHDLRTPELLGGHQLWPTTPTTSTSNGHGSQIHLPMTTTVLRGTDATLLRIIGLDSCGENQTPGWITQQHLQDLNAELGREFHGLTLILVHHPPTDAPVACMKGKHLANSEELAQTLTSNRMQVDAILCGHFHHGHLTDLVGIPLWCGPSASYNVFDDWQQDPTGWISVIDLHPNATEFAADDDGALTEHADTTPAARTQPVITVLPLTTPAATDAEYLKNAEHLRNTEQLKPQRIGSEQN